MHVIIIMITVDGIITLMDLATIAITIIMVAPILRSMATSGCSIAVRIRLAAGSPA